MLLCWTITQDFALRLHRVAGNNPSKMSLPDAYFARDSLRCFLWIAKLHITSRRSRSASPPAEPKR